jgi:para-nitrobenzyl esterase
VPMLIGTNQDEYKLYTNTIGYNVLPLASDELREAVGRYASDLWRVNGADSIATRLRALDDYPAIYVYRFNWGSPDEDGNSPLPGNFGATGGAHHAAELPFVFGNPDSFILNDFKDLLYNEANEASRETISQVMVSYWGNFITQADPNGDNQPSWSPWSNTEGDFRAIVLDVNYADKQPKITEDYTVWTTERVLAAIDTNVMEPLRSELLPYLEGRINPE